MHNYLIYIVMILNIITPDYERLYAFLNTLNTITTSLTKTQNSLFSILKVSKTQKLALKFMVKFETIKAEARHSHTNR